MSGNDQSAPVIVTELDGLGQSVAAEMYRRHLTRRANRTFGDDETHPEPAFAPDQHSISSATYEQLLDTFTPDQRELRQLLAVKLRALASSVEGINSTRPATAGEIQREVARLGDIAGALV